MREAGGDRGVSARLPGAVGVAQLLAVGPAVAVRVRPTQLLRPLLEQPQVKINYVTRGTGRHVV